MKKKFLVGNLMKFRSPIYIVLFLALVSCQPDENKLGLNLLPPGDAILVYTDTLYNLETQLVKSTPVLTSVNAASPANEKIYLLGTLQDSITGLSRAEIVTQISPSTLRSFGTNPLLDSLALSLYCSDIEGDAGQNMRIMIHEFIGDLSYEEPYYSDFDVTGLYDPVPLVDEVVVLMHSDTTLEFPINSPDFIERIGQAIKDSAIYDIDSIQDVFRGFYITTEVEAGSNTMAKIGMGSISSSFSFQYVHDSVHVDSVTSGNWDEYHLNFTEYYAQKVNIFHHDFSGTALEQVIDNPDAHPPVLYVQGMAGVNVEIAIPEFDNYLDQGPISINGARLVFEVIPDSISGISEDDYPKKLMLKNLLTDSTSQYVYDYVTNGSNFGNLSRSNSVSAFLPPLYEYKFSLGMHFQSVLTGAIENNKLILSIDDPGATARIIKLWSNDSDHKGSLRLELVYTKF